MALPIRAVEGLQREAREGVAVEAPNVHVHAVRMGARRVERMNTACATERVLRDVGVEGVRREVARADEELERLGRDDEMDESLLLANAAIAIEGFEEARANAKSNAAAMTAAGERERADARRFLAHRFRERAAREWQSSF